MSGSRKLAFSDYDMKRYARLRGSTYLQQSAFVTSMIVSYGRAFT